MAELTEENFKIHIKTYLRTTRIIDFLTIFLKVNIRLHEKNDAVQEGDIFVFNHFSRFETFVPQYLFFKKSKALCRSIAAAEFFDEGVLSRYLLNLGAIPHNYFDIFNFLAKEINRGIKLVVFPEGSMIKDKNVMDESGIFSIYSRDKRTRRRPHTGAAVIALRTESYRFLYRLALKKEDKDKIDLYSTHFSMTAKAGQKKIYDRPTHIVPANITFYPLRISENLLNILAERMGKKNLRLAEEIAIEGNFITKDTDMDIHLSTPINVYNYFTFIDKILLKILYHLKIEPGFDIKRSSSFLNILFGRSYDKRIKFLARRLTNRYMKEIYSHVTINISHIVAMSIFYNIKKKKGFNVAKNKFYTLLYCIITEIQKEKALILHPQLKDPELYGSILDGKNNSLDRFLLMIQDVGLLTITDETFFFLPGLLAKYEFDTIRLENMPKVRFNEVQPLKPLKNIVKKVIKNFNQYEKKKLPELLFEEDQAIYHDDKEKFSGPEYEELNKKEVKTLSGEPFFLRSQKIKKRETGILLIHGFPASPAEMKPLGKFLNHAGYTVYGVRLRGYGTSPYDLEQTSWDKCIESIEQGYKVLSLTCKRVVPVGFSFGAVVALDLAGRARKNICGAVSISASIEVEGMDDILLAFSAQINKLFSLIPGIKTKFIDWKTESPEINYQSVPLQKIIDIKNYIEQVKEKLKAISIPLLIIQGTQDPFVKRHSAELIYENVSSKDKKLFWYESDKHIIVTQNCIEVYKNIITFMKKL